jgi:hypothetical protein
MFFCTNIQPLQHSITGGRNSKIRCTGFVYKDLVRKVAMSVCRDLLGKRAWSVNFRRGPLKGTSDDPLTQAFLAGNQKGFCTRTLAINATSFSTTNVHKNLEFTNS